MTREELQEKLEKLNLTDRFSLYGEMIPDRFIIAHWDFFEFDERGVIRPITTIQSESELYEFVYNFALQMIERDKFAKKIAQEFEYEQKHTKTIVKTIQGGGFTMTDTKKVFDPGNNKT